MLVQIEDPAWLVLHLSLLRSAQCSSLYNSHVDDPLLLGHCGFNLKLQCDQMMARHKVLPLTLTLLTLWTAGPLSPNRLYLSGAEWPSEPITDFHREWQACHSACVIALSTWGLKGWCSQVQISNGTIIRFSEATSRDNMLHGNDKVVHNRGCVMLCT